MMHKERTWIVYKNEQMMLEGQEADEPDQSHGLMVHCYILLPGLVADHRIMYQKRYWNNEKIGEAEKALVKELTGQGVWAQC